MRLGILGLGRAARQVLRAANSLPFVRVTAAADIRPDARSILNDAAHVQFYSSVEELANCNEVDVVWVATPSALHCEHVVRITCAGKHVICEKPIALTLPECDQMIQAASRAGVQLLIVSKKFDPPITAMREVVDSGRLGRVICVNSIVFTDWMQRPRLAEEFDTTRGGGVVFRQAPHLVDIARYLAGGMVQDVRARTGRHDPRFATEGDYSAFLTFEAGAVASLLFNGYGYFDSSELTGGYGEGGNYSDPRAARNQPRDWAETVDAATKSAHLDALARAGSRPEGLPHYGQTIISCERGVIRQSPQGLFIYSAEGCEELVLDPRERCTGELLEMHAALTSGRPVFPDGAWGRATLEVCIAMLRSSAEERPVTLNLQSRAPG